MSQVLVFNALSLPFNTPVEADAGVPMLLRVLARLHSFKFGLIIRMGAALDPNWYNLELAPGYRFQNWLRQHHANAQYRDLIRRFKSFVVNQPEIPTDEIEGVRNALDAGLENEPGHDIFRACVYYGAALLSLATQPRWQQACLSLWVQRLEAEAPEVHNLTQFSTEATLTFHQPRLEAERSQRLNSGKALWAERENAFPLLTLTGKMSDLLCWSHSHTVLQQGQQALQKLNDFCEGWREGVYSDYQHEHLKKMGLDVSGESQSVAQHATKRKERECFLPNGHKVYCENHIKLTQYFRLYFYPEPAEKRIYVVYFGPHLKL